MKRNFTRLGGLMIVALMAATALTAQRADTLTVRTHWPDGTITYDKDFFIKEKAFTGKESSISISMGTSIPIGDFSIKGATPLLGNGYGNANLGRSVNLQYTNYFYKGILGITTSLGYDYFGIDNESYNHALNFNPDSPIKEPSLMEGSSDDFAGGWNIFSISVGPSVRLLDEETMSIDLSALIGMANCRIPETTVYLIPDHNEKFSDLNKIEMNSESVNSIYYALKLTPMFPMGKRTFLTISTGVIFGLRPSFMSHDFTFSEDGNRTPKKTTYPITAHYLSIGISYKL